MARGRICGTKERKLLKVAAGNLVVRTWVWKLVLHQKVKSRQLFS